MPHDKTRAAARKRMAETGEPYTAARRAVLGGQRAARADVPSPGGGYLLQMSGEIHDWLAELRDSDEPAATHVVNALATLMLLGASTGDPLVVSTADAWPWALAEALDRSYRERLERVTAARQSWADAVALAKDIQDQAAGLNGEQAELERLHRHALAAGWAREAAEAAVKLATIQQQAAEMRERLPEVIQARDRLAKAVQRLQVRADAFRLRKEGLRASYVAARTSLQLLEAEAIEAPGRAGEDGYRQRQPSGEAICAAEARLADLTAQMGRELGQQEWPEGLMELRPGVPPGADIRILFAVEPPGAALLIAVVEGRETMEDLYPEAVLISADVLRRVRTGQDPEAAAYTYNDPQSFLVQFRPVAPTTPPPAPENSL